MSAPRERYACQPAEDRLRNHLRPAGGGGGDRSREPARTAPQLRAGTEQSYARQINDPRTASAEIAIRAALDHQVTDDTRRTTILFAALLVACLLTAGFVFDRLIASIERPLQRLVDAAGKLASGDLRARVSVGGPSETAALGVAFNEMADELQSAYRRLEESRERLSVTLESLSDGVITLDESGTVTDANPAARRLVPWADVGTPIRELLASLADRRSIERLLAGGEPRSSTSARARRPWRSPPRSSAPRRAARCSRSATSPSGRGWSG